MSRSSPIAAAAKLCAVLLAATFGLAAASQGAEPDHPQKEVKLPAGFVALREIDPTIRQDIRYASDNNFTGRPVAGYDAPECILTREAAQALSEVQGDLKQQGLTLKVFDCYRPRRAVADFVQWARSRKDDTRARYYPREVKSQLFNRGYIASRSAHSRGSTIDLTIERLEPSDTAASWLACEALTQRSSEVDMGTGFDCFDVKSSVGNGEIGDDQKKNRDILGRAMRAHGFRGYPREWWHFTLRDEPYSDTSFDFPVAAPAAR